MTVPPTRWRLAALAAALVACTVPTADAAAQSAFASRANSGMCMDLPGGNLAESTQIVLYPCHGGENQQFIVQSDGHIVVKNGQTDSRGYQMCLDAYPGRGNNGDAVRIWPCRPLGGTDTQRWTRLSSGEFRNSTGRCIDIQGGLGNSGRNGNPLVLWDCPDPDNYNTRRWDARGGSSSAAVPTPPGDAQLAQQISAGLNVLVQRFQQMDRMLGAGQRDLSVMGGQTTALWMDEVKPLFSRRLAAYRSLAAQGGPHASELNRRAEALNALSKRAEVLATMASTFTRRPPGQTPGIPEESRERVQQTFRSIVTQLQQVEQLHRELVR